jgi:ComF family protein
MAIPLHSSRERWRGFNQSLLLAKEIASVNPWPLSNGLKRKKSNHNQAGLKMSERRQNLTNTFYFKGQSLEGENILLIDDVVTSGQTLNQAAKALKKAGAESVWALVLAKK